MPRPKQFRLLKATPIATRFVPEGTREDEIRTVTLCLDEFEALRLADLAGLSQETAARRMKVSRATFGRIVESARRAVVSAIAEGCTLEIGGGVFRYAQGRRLRCPRCRHSQPMPPADRTEVVCRHCTHPLQGVETHPGKLKGTEKHMDVRNAKIAIVTDEGTTVSSHFGRALHYEVLTFHDGQIAQRERREKFSPHARGEGEGMQHQHHEGNHGTMLAPIRDCQIVVARGMGNGAYMHLTSDGFTVYLTDLHTIDEVANAIATGNLHHNEGRVHHKDHAHT